MPSESERMSKPSDPVPTRFQERRLIDKNREKPLTRDYFETDEDYDNYLKRAWRIEAWGTDPNHSQEMKRLSKKIGEITKKEVAGRIESLRDGPNTLEDNSSVNPIIINPQPDKEHLRKILTQQIGELNPHSDLPLLKGSPVSTGEEKKEGPLEGLFDRYHRTSEGNLVGEIDINQKDREGNKIRVGRGFFPIPHVQGNAEQDHSLIRPVEGVFTVRNNRNQEQDYGEKDILEKTGAYNFNQSTVLNDYKILVRARWSDDGVLINEKEIQEALYPGEPEKPLRLNSILNKIPFTVCTSEDIEGTFILVKKDFRSNHPSDSIHPATDDLIAFMNEALRLDPDWLQKLIENVPSCNNNILNHPTIQCDTKQGFLDFVGTYCCGLLGLLNGFCGILLGNHRYSKYGPITMEVDKSTGKIVQFLRTEEQLAKEI